MNNEENQPHASTTSTTGKRIVFGAGFGMLVGVLAGAALTFAASITVPLAGFGALALAFGALGGLRGLQQSRHDQAVAASLETSVIPSPPQPLSPEPTLSRDRGMPLENDEVPERYFRDRITAEAARKALLSMDPTTAARH